MSVNVWCLKYMLPMITQLVVKYIFMTYKNIMHHVYYTLIIYLILKSKQCTNTTIPAVYFLVAFVQCNSLPENSI